MEMNRYKVLESFVYMLIYTFSLLHFRGNVLLLHLFSSHLLYK